MTGGDIEDAGNPRISIQPTCEMLRKRSVALLHGLSWIHCPHALRHVQQSLTDCVVVNLGAFMSIQDINQEIGNIVLNFALVPV